MSTAHRICDGFSELFSGKGEATIERRLLSMLHCPACAGPLQASDERIACTSCRYSSSVSPEFVDLSWSPDAERVCPQCARLGPVIARPVLRLCRIVGVRVVCRRCRTLIDQLDLAELTPDLRLTLELVLLGDGGFCSRIVQWRRLVGARRAWEGLAARIAELADVHTGDTACDLACATGAVLLRLARNVAPTGTVFGVEPSARMLRDVFRMTRRVQADDVLLLRADSGQVPLRAGSCTAVTAMLLLGTTGLPERVVNEAARLLRPGGRFVADVSCGGAISRPDHKIARNELHTWASAAGLTVSREEMHNSTAIYVLSKPG